MGMRPSGNQRRVYRFALYGVRASGKTCILAALSMPRAANPKRYTCSWIEEEPGNPLPHGIPSEWDTNDPFHLGWRWLSEQRERLKSGEVPQPNVIREDPTRYLFDFSAPDRGAFRVELVDYSGELITATSSELAARLRGHMQDCDGIFLLAEAPYPNRDLAPLTEDFEKLKGAFNILLGERDASPQQDWPLAILLNKWDRLGPIAFETPDAEHQKLNDFLDGPLELPHKALVHVVENVVSEKNLLVSPVSAFGAHEIGQDGMERPKLNGGQLRSFGLEDPFVWVAGRRDELDVEQLEIAASRCSWWQFWHALIGRPLAASAGPAAESRDSVMSLLRGLSPIRCIGAGLGLRGRLPKESTLTRRLGHSLRKACLKLGSQLVVGLAVLVLLFLIGEAAMDGVRYRQVLANERNPAPSAGSLDADEEWLAGYFQSPAHRHFLAKQFLLEPSGARLLLEGSRSRRDEATWAPIPLETSEPETQFVLAKRYLDAFPKGEHASEATLIVASGEQRRHERENLDAIRSIEGELQALVSNGSQSEESIRALLGKIDTLPHPTSVSEGVDQARKELRERLYERLESARVAGEEERWSKFRNALLVLLREEKIGEAASHLASWDRKDPRLDELVRLYREQCVAIVRNQVDRHIKSRVWPQARDALRRACDDPSVAQFLSADQVRSLESLRGKVDEAEDRDLYDQIKKYRPNCRDQVAQYLKSAPVGRMRREVQAYNAYLDQISGPLDLKVALSQIEWGDAYHDYIHEVRVTIDGKGIIDQSLKARRHTRTGQVGTEAIIHKALNDEIHVNVQAVRKAWWVGQKDADAGSGEFKGTVSGLNGRTIVLSAQDHTNKASFVVTGLPQEPPLPAWGGK